MAELTSDLLQVLRERPPGYGGIERVAHELAQRYGGTTLSMSGYSLSSALHSSTDPLPVSYRRVHWPVFCLGRLRIPLPVPSLFQQILNHKGSLLLHLPCPAILLLALTIRLLQPHRPIHLYWHAFLDARRWRYRLYQRVALCLARRASTVVTTSPVLITSLAECGINLERLLLLPPVLPRQLELHLQQLPPPSAPTPLQLLCIGRLDSYKRLDWVIQALASMPEAVLTIAGSGPDQAALQALAQQLGLLAEGRVHFLGRVSEPQKLGAIARAHLIVLAADSCHEAFGISQLEAMAAGRVAISFDQPRSGMAWVNGLQLPPHHPCRHPGDLAAVLQQLAADPSLLHSSSEQARLRYERLFSRPCWLERCRDFEMRLRIAPIQPCMYRAAVVLDQPGHSAPVIRLRGATVRIPVVADQARSLKTTLIRSVTGGSFLRSRRGTEVLALDQLILDIYHGERIALIGHNGAGKSTFLRLISGIYVPSDGEVQVSVEVFPMLHKSFVTSPELSGLQAAKAHYLMVRRTLRGFDEFLDSVLEFSGLGDYIHLPIKGYSDGMAARLLFSILTGFCHDCLALDEGFGTGDAQFFEKAQQRLTEFVRSAGTLILASHSDALLRRFCTRGLVFQSGRLVFDGPLEAALAYYHAS
mgnify:CR=1 FL=1